MNICIFVRSTGERCNIVSLENSQYCFLHDPNLLSIVFVSEYSHYKKGDVCLGIKKNKAENFMSLGVAIKLDKKLYKRFVDKKD